MPYRKFTFDKGHYYHLYNRGNNHQPVFFERDNYLFFLQQCRKLLLPETMDVVAYCLMPNHYHMLAYLKADDLSRPMQRLLLSYTKAINRRFGRTGSLFQGRFRAIPVEQDAYLVHLSRYIHLNPVAAGLVGRPEDWEFSSYPEFVGMRQGTLPRPDSVLCQFPSPDAYRRFVDSLPAGDDRLIKHLILE